MCRLRRCNRSNPGCYSSNVFRILIAAKLSHTMRGTFPRPAHQPAKTRSSIRSKRAASCSLNSSSRMTDRSRNPALGWVNRTFGRKFLLQGNGSAPSVTQHKIRRRASVRRFWKEPPEFSSGVTRTYRPRIWCRKIHIQSSVSVRHAEVRRPHNGRCARSCGRLASGSLWSDKRFRRRPLKIFLFAENDVTVWQCVCEPRHSFDWRVRQLLTKLPVFFVWIPGISGEHRIVHSVRRHGL